MRKWSTDLRSFYDRERIGVRGFACVHQDECKAAAHPRDLYQGAEAHVGTRYGSALRIVVVSLDTGHAPSALDERRRIIESLVPTELNPHMRGTTTLLQRLLADGVPGGSNVYEYFAMINAAKCSGRDGSKDKLPSSIYRTCRPYALEELAILQPQLLVTQGNDAAAALGWPELRDKDLVSTVIGRLAGTDLAREWLDAVAQEYLGQLALAGCGNVPTLMAPHPSARDGRWQRFERMSLAPLVAILKGIVQATA